MADLTSKITAASQTTMAGEKGGLVPAVLVVYYLGDFGPFSFTIPTDRFSAEAAKQIIGAMALELSQLVS